MSKIYSTFRAKLIYIFRINDNAHNGCLKIGETTLLDDTPLEAAPNSKALNEAARLRIRQYTATAGIQFELLYTECALARSDKGRFSISDKDVHKVLLRSGIKRAKLGEDMGVEWFRCDLETAKRAITAVKEGKSSLLPHEITQYQSPIVFRPEQQDAIGRTCTRFRTSNRMLWNAKMRFGKTLSALEVVKRMQFARTIILTHRPEVNASWFEDFGKIFYNDKTYLYGSKKLGDDFEKQQKDLKLLPMHEIGEMEKACRVGKVRYIYFASMQDLRGSEDVGGKYDKNNQVFSTDWDCVIIDEAHEGTQTALGQAVLGALTGKETKVLQLSGTPFNLFDQFDKKDIYTWDYVMEQQAKQDWDKKHFGDSNPYAGLPKMNIYTFDLGRLMEQYMDMDVAFNFTEFFRTREDGSFIHEQDIRSFLALLCLPDKNSLFPYSCREFREQFHHTLWLLPGVRAAKALSALLKEHDVFKEFEIVNVAGEGDEGAECKDALKKVQSAIQKFDYTITLSCGRLTTGVSVPEWTAVFMLSGSFNTAASSYMQTIFRVQTPATINGLTKENCYVFDFAPDRTLRVVAETAKVNTKAGQTTHDDRTTLGAFLNFCPIIACEGTEMKDKVTADHLIEQLKKVYIARVVSSGFEDKSLYNDELLRLNNIDLQEFAKLKKIIGSTKAQEKTNEIDINRQGLTDEQYEQIRDIERRPVRERTPEEEEQLRELQAAKKQRNDAISILRGISIRLPLLIYGAELTGDIREVTIDNFADLIDDASWEEFMPRGVDKVQWLMIRKYYDPDIFLAAGKRIRALAEAADHMPIEQRIAQIATIFNTFRNPDKETVLTPWRVVNRHMADTIGGYSFYNKDYTEEIEEPRWVEQIGITDKVFRSDSKILEINSKTGLYPLYVAYSLYRAHLQNALYSVDTIEEQQRIWDKVVSENVFVICKTQMAKSITRRTLLGFRQGKANLHAFDNLINYITNDQKGLIARIQKGQVFTNFKHMQFNAIVGNPPYQLMDGGGVGSSAVPIYQNFVTLAKQLQPNYISLIIPSRWMTGGKGLNEFRDKMISDRHIHILHDYADSAECFSGVDIKGGVCYFLWDKSHNELCHTYRHNVYGIFSSIRPLKEDGCDVFIRENTLVSIYKKVSSCKETTFDTITSSRKPYGLAADAIKTPQKYDLPTMATKHISDGYTLLGLDDKNNRINRYLPKNYPFVHANGLDKYKVFLSKAYGCGEIGEVPATPVTATPGMLCTETFIQMGPFDTENEMLHCLSYMKTKFFRTLVGIRKQTQNTARATYSFVPLQDFTDQSDIDWTQSIPKIDRQLYEKYQLSNDEIAFIEQVVKPME